MNLQSIVPFVRDGTNEPGLVNIIHVSICIYVYCNIEVYTKYLLVCFSLFQKKGVDYTIWTYRNRADDYKFIYNKVNDGQTYKRQTDTK